MSNVARPLAAFDHAPRPKFPAGGPTLATVEAVDAGGARTVLAGVRLATVVLWSVTCIPLQALCLVLPGKAKVAFPRVYWRGMCFCVGLSLRRVRRDGAAPAGRPIVYVANHSSWLDILVLGAVLPAAFVSKDEVRSWPGIGLIARMGRTIFVERRRATTRRERDAMRERLAHGHNIILFPEGTSSDGTRVLPFRPSFFAAAMGDEGVAPIVCPVSVAYDRVGYLPTGRATRSLFAWYGDMALVPHAWKVLRQRGTRASVLWAPPLDPTEFASRKALAIATWDVVAGGAATLRQNREPVAVSASPAAADAAYAS